MKYQKLFALAVAMLTAGTLACTQSPAPPTSPAANGGGITEAGPDGSTLKVTAPTAVSPTGGVEVDDDDPDLVINNSTARFVQSLPLAYVFEVMDEGVVIYRSNPVPAGGNGQTSHEISTVLNFDEAYTWRAYAVYQGQRGPMSAGANFRTFNRFGISCSHLPSEAAIVNCRRAQYGFMSVPERIEFLRRIAYDLNRAGFEHRPYGVLVKTDGHNCNGYSCDIICSNANGMQRQWDTLSDEDGAQGPKWERLPQISVRPCEAVQ